MPPTTLNSEEPVKDIKKCTARVKAVHFFIFSFHGRRLERLA